MRVPHRHTVLALLSCVTLYFSLAAGQPQGLKALRPGQVTNRSGASPQRLAASEACRIPVYMNLRVINDGARIHMQWESRYLLQVVLAGMPSMCGCTLQLHDRHGDAKGNNTSVQAIQQLPSMDAPALVVVVQGGNSPDIYEANAIHQVKDVARQKLVVIHLGDERTDIPNNVSWYPHVKAVFRNYHRHTNTSALSPLQSWMRYIMPAPGPTTHHTMDGTSDATDGTADTTDGAPSTADGMAETVTGMAETADGRSSTTDGTAETVAGISGTVDGTAAQAKTRKLVSSHRTLSQRRDDSQSASHHQDGSLLSSTRLAVAPARRRALWFQLWQQSHVQQQADTTTEQADATTEQGDIVKEQGRLWQQTDIPKEQGDGNKPQGDGGKEKKHAVHPPPVQDDEALRRQDHVYQGSNVFWFPLGYGEYFVPNPTLQSAFHERPLLWAWAGSEGGKMERQHMLEHFSKPPLSQLGELHVIQVFRSLRMMGAAQYTSMLYSAKLVPLPKGVHAEQYRLWEALAAGAVPIAMHKHAATGLAHIALLGFKLLWIDEWADAPKLLLQVLRDAKLQEELGAWQEHNLQLYERVMSKVAAQVAHSVCT